MVMEVCKLLLLAGRGEREREGRVCVRVVGRCGCADFAVRALGRWAVTHIQASNAR
jgi:hypothetical protein